ncbi:unnamed protein product [Rangifer tarandus platyrhynchus]|uniref:Uncharacterized protein n=1 Tax=Rangifer tarandus platyrhynchus TaxID=3082113 RepID=A0ABN8ZTH7_RANTA|nr:unnamed protein product [Rangifer tarandus platyrhynchus]
MRRKLCYCGTKHIKPIALCVTYPGSKLPGTFSEHFCTLPAARMCPGRYTLALKFGLKQDKGEKIGIEGNIYFVYTFLYFPNFSIMNMFYFLQISPKLHN